MKKPNDDAQRKSISKPYCFRNEYLHTYCLVQLPFDRSSAAHTLAIYYNCCFAYELILSVIWCAKIN